MSDTDKRPVTIEDLHGYADGQLPIDRAEEVETYLRAHPDAEAQVQDYRAINAALREAVALDTSWTANSKQQAPSGRRRSVTKMAMAAMLGGLLMGGTVGWASHGYFSSDGTGMRELAQRAASAYTVYAPDTTQPVEMLAGDADRLAARLSKRMQMAFHIPNLDKMGFTLVGGRLMIGRSAPAALLMYENAQGRRVVLYVRNDLPDEQPTKMRYRRSDTSSIVYWRDTGAGFGLAGGFTEQEMMPLANIIRADFSS